MARKWWPIKSWSLCLFVLTGASGKHVENATRVTTFWRGWAWHHDAVCQHKAFIRQRKKTLNDEWDSIVNVAKFKFNFHLIFNVALSPFSCWGCGECRIGEGLRDHHVVDFRSLFLAPFIGADIDGCLDGARMLSLAAEALVASSLGAHQPSSAGEKALFVSVTATTPKTFRTMKLAGAEDDCSVVPPHSIKSVQNAFRTIADVDVGAILEMFRPPRWHCDMPCFVAHRQIMTAWDMLLAQHVLSCQRAWSGAKTVGHIFLKSHLVRDCEIYRENGLQQVTCGKASRK
jgi:hypothetical protein